MGEPWIRDGAETAMLRSASIRRLVGLREAEQLSVEHVVLVAGVLGVHERTVWRWVAEAAGSGKIGPAGRSRFSIDGQLRVRLAYHRGNAAALHRELVEVAAATGGIAPSLDTVQRAIRRDLTRGERAGLRKGERARARHDVYLRRPDTHRNAVWEGDHVQADVEVDVDGTLMKPWITWFIDAATDAVAGVAVTPQHPTRASVLTALRASISRAGPFGPVGGLPELVRIDRGKDFLSGAVASALAVFAVEVHVLPPYASWGKGHVEALNGAAARMLFARLPRYTHAQKLVNNARADKDAPPLKFESFVAEVLSFVGDWNTVRPKPALGGRTPLEAWNADPTPIHEVPETDLVLFTLEDDGKARRITTKGVHFAGQFYVGDAMAGRVGDKVRIRWMPNHPEIIEVFDADTGEYLGSAVPADQASSELAAAVLAARARKARELASDLKAAERARRVRYAAATTAAPPKALGIVSKVQAETELAEVRDADTAAVARPDLFARRPAAASWVLPRSARHGDDDDRNR